MATNQSGVITDEEENPLESVQQSASETLTPTSAAPAPTPTPSPSTGIINSQMPDGYDPAKVDVTDDMTVQGQFNKITKQGSPLMDMARTSANQQMNARGLINSSMAVGESDKAAYAAALPIAQADAATNFNAAQTNAGAANQMNLQVLTGQQQQVLANIEAQYKMQMQANDSAARFYAQISASIGEILAQPDITVASKEQLVKKQTELLQSGLAVIGGISNLDLTGLLDFGGTATGGAPSSGNADDEGGTTGQDGGSGGSGNVTTEPPEDMDTSPQAMIEYLESLGVIGKTKKGRYVYSYGKLYNPEWGYYDLLSVPELKQYAENYANQYKLQQSTGLSAEDIANLLGVQDSGNASAIWS